MSMAKGLLPDNHPLSAISCRSMIMEQADVVVLVGARLNWLLSRGHGKWNPDNKYVQLDIEPTEIDCNVPVAAPVIGDLGASLDMILEALPDYKISMDPQWVKDLQAHTADANKWIAQALSLSRTYGSLGRTESCQIRHRETSGGYAYQRRREHA